MATVEIYEHGGLRGGLPCMQFPILAKQTLTIASTTATSAVFNSGTTYITACSTDRFRFVIAATPTSTGAHVLWPADVPFQASVIPGHKFLALSATTT
jgi:hypothetical protein